MGLEKTREALEGLSVDMSTEVGLLARRRLLPLVAPAGRIHPWRGTWAGLRKLQAELFGELLPAALCCISQFLGEGEAVRAVTMMSTLEAEFEQRAVKVEQGMSDLEEATTLLVDEVDRACAGLSFEAVSVLS